jgi:hypothetical protein
MSKASYEFGVVCEALADRDTACGLADRVLLEEVSWLAPETLESCRRWRGLRSEEPYLRVGSVKEEAQRIGLKIFGQFNDEPGQPDAVLARRALLLLAGAERRPDAVLLVRDGDAQRDRQGLEQARDYKIKDKPWPFQVIIGLADPKRECWVLAGFEPKNEKEEERLEKERQRLSFHPVREAHKLTAREHGAKKDAKVALDALTQEDKERERACLEEMPLAILEERGKETGLAEYLKEIRERLVPILGGRSQSP